MRWINVDTVIHAQVYDDEHEELLLKTMTVEEFLDAYTEEGCPTVVLEPKSERKKGKWTKDCACEICGFEPWYERDIHTLSFCPICGADMRGGEE